MVNPLQKLDKLKRTFKAGDTIIKEGAMTTEFYILVDGAAEVLVNNHVVTQINASKGALFFGEMASILSESRSASIVATQKCVVLCVPANGLLKVLQLSPSLLSKLLQQLASRVKSLNEDNDRLGEEEKILKSAIEIAQIETLNYFKAIVGLVEVLAEQTGHEAFSGLKEYILLSNPFNIRKGSTAQLKMDILKETNLDQYFK